MYDNTQKQQYLAYATATQTVAKTKQIVLLYDGVIRFMKQAREAIEQSRIEDRYHLLMKCSNIIVGMQSALDFEQAPEIAKVLYSYYASVDNRIFSLHRTNDVAMCDEIIADLKQMRDVWDEIDQGATEKAPQEPADMPSSATPITPDAALLQNLSVSA